MLSVTNRKQHQVIKFDRAKHSYVGHGST